MPECLHAQQPEVAKFDRGAPDRTAEHRRDGGFAVRLGLTEVQGLGTEVAERIVAARAERPFADMADVSRRSGVSVRQMEALATAGAFDCFGISRRQALWNSGYVESANQLEGTSVTLPPPMLPGMSPVELTLADLWATRISPDDHPIGHLRDLLDAKGILPIGSLMTAEPDRRIKVAGLITHRQRPYTAGGVTFLNLEDETGMLNVVCSAALWQRYRRVGRNAAGMIIRGILERNEGVTNLIADKLMRIEEAYPETAGSVPPRHTSRDFH